MTRQRMFAQVLELINRHGVRSVYTCPVCKGDLMLVGSARSAKGWLCPIAGHTGIIPEGLIARQLLAIWPGQGNNDDLPKEVRLVMREMRRRQGGSSVGGGEG